MTSNRLCTAVSAAFAIRVVLAAATIRNFRTDFYARQRTMCCHLLCILSDCCSRAQAYYAPHLAILALDKVYACVLAVLLLPIAAMRQLLTGTRLPTHRDMCLRAFITCC
jgi:hypothetical protein